MRSASPPPWVDLVGLFHLIRRSNQIYYAITNCVWETQVWEFAKCAPPPWVDLVGLFHLIRRSNQIYYAMANFALETQVWEYAECVSPPTGSSGVIVYPTSACP